MSTHEGKKSHGSNTWAVGEKGIPNHWAIPLFSSCKWSIKEIQQISTLDGTRPSIGWLRTQKMFFSLILEFIHHNKNMKQHIRWGDWLTQIKGSLSTAMFQNIRSIGRC